MAPRVKTRDRIVAESLELFNAQGERNVTTNHIAAHLGMSPGNLYYHFRNKQAIIAELFAQYEAQVDQFLRRPEGRALTVADKTFYLEALLAAMWHYRFLHRDLEHLLEADPELAARYRTFAQRCMVQAQGIYQGFVEAGILLMEPAQVEALTLNSWIIMTSWCAFSAPPSAATAISVRTCCAAASIRCWRWRAAMPAPRRVRRSRRCSRNCSCRLMPSADTLLL